MLSDNKKIKEALIYCNFFARVLFSRNFADGKSPENETFAKWHNHFVVYVGKSCPSCGFLTWQICLLKLFAKNNSHKNF